MGSAAEFLTPSYLSYFRLVTTEMRAHLWVVSLRQACCCGGGEAPGVGKQPPRWASRFWA